MHVDAGRKQVCECEGGIVQEARACREALDHPGGAGRAGRCVDELCCAD
jgi:hypothetical protein